MWITREHTGDNYRTSTLEQNLINVIQEQLNLIHRYIF